jgi:hypothetical protein
MKYIKMLAMLWLSEVIRAWRKDDVDPVSGPRERPTLPSLETLARERRERHDTLRSSVAPYESTNVKQAPRSPYGAN